MYKTIIFILVMLHFFSCNAQKNEIKIQSFFESIFVEQDLTYKELYTKYVSTKYLEKEQIDSFEDNIKYLKSLNLFLNNRDSISFSVTKYKKSELTELLPFSEEALDNIFVVSVNSKIVTYVLMNESKIIAFNTVRKGKRGPAYFLPF